jgi:hypothetical protein
MNDERRKIEREKEGKREKKEKRHIGFLIQEYV